MSMSTSASAAAERTITGADDLLLHHHGLFYHVPQHSRREKLRFQPDNSPSLPSLSYSLAHYASGGGGGGLAKIQPPQAFSLTLSPTASPLPLGPFTGYAAVLNRSSFLDPARQLLEEIYDFGRAGALAVASGGDPPELLSVDHEVAAEERQWKRASLISMIDEVCRRYKVYCQQVQTVITSFEMVAGLSTAAPYVSLAIKAMAKHFMCLKNVMSNKLERINKTPAKEGFARMEFSNYGTCLQQRENNSDAFRQPHIWRPQRGLPENAVAVLRSWLFEHFLHPYPTDVDKQLLAKQTGLTRNQVSNWFINARVRLWKPMVEDIHNLELRQLQKSATAGESQMAGEHPPRPSLSAAASSSNQPRQSCSNIPRSQTFSSRPYLNNDLPYITQHIDEPYGYVYSNLSDRAADVVGVDVGQGLGVSLTLGLRQNNGARFPAESIPAGVARRFGLEDCGGDAYVVGKSNGGHLLHDFVG